MSLDTKPTDSIVTKDEQAGPAMKLVTGTGVELTTEERNIVSSNPQQPHQPPQQHQPRPHQPNQQQHQQLRHHQHPAHQQTHPANYQTMPPQFTSYGPPPPAASYNPRNFGQQQGPIPYPYHPSAVYAFGYAQPNSWQAPPYVGAPHAQPIPANMVPTQPPANLPQQHNKQPPQIINANLNNERPHNQSLPQVSSVPNQTAVRQPRKKMVATLKDPKTKEVVPLVEDSVTTKPQQQKQPQQPLQLQQQQSQPQQFTQPTLTNTNTNTNSKAINITKTTSPNTLKQEPVHTLLQKVSEDGLVDAASAIVPPVINVAQKKNVGPKDTNNQVGATNKENIPVTNVEPSEPEDKKDVNEEKLLVVEPKEDTLRSNDQVKVKEQGKDNSIKNSDAENDQEGEVKDRTNEVDAGESQVSKADSADNDQIEDSKKEDQSSDSSPELQYEPEQFHPVSNRDGRRVYSRQFLLDVCKKICKIDLEGGRPDDSANEAKFNLGSQVDMFAPTFSRGGAMNRPLDTNRRQSHQNYAGRSSAGQEKQRKVINCTSLTQDVELKTASNPWRPTKEIKDATPTDEEDTEALKKKFRSILNKLTPNNFENLAKAVSELTIDSESKLGEVIDIVFAKALAEPGYCSLYGQMCSHLKKVSAGSANFFNTLLKRCQIQFQSDIYSGVNVKERREKIDNESDPVIKKQLEDELYDDMFRCRLRGLGLIKFIGELYKIEMLNDAIMFDCVLRLLNDPSEESLECLCDLLQTIGEKLDTSFKNNQAKEEKKAPKNNPKPSAYQGGKSAAAIVASGLSNQQHKEQPSGPATLDQVFERLHKIRKNKDSNLSVRIKFKILDVCELRERDNWKSKKSKDNPKTIDEIKADHIEKQEQERRANIGGRRSQEGRRLGPSGGSSSQISSLANESGGHRGNSHMHTSSSSNVIHRDMSGNDNTKTNYDVEQHGRNISFLKTVLTNRKENSSSNEALMPSTQFRPHTRLGPQSRVIQPRDSSNAGNK